MSIIHDMPGHLIRRLHQISVASFAANLRASGFDLTPVQFGALITVRDNPGIDQATLAGLIAHDRVTIGAVLSRLEKRGLISREVREDDRRARRLKLTERGLSVVTTATPAVRATQAQILAGLEPQEVEEFMRLMYKLTEINNHLSRSPLEG